MTERATRGGTSIGVAVVGAALCVAAYWRFQARQPLDLARPRRESARCINRPEPVADDAVTALGRVAELVRAADGVYRAELYWTSKLEWVEHAAMGGRSRLELSLRRQGPARLVHSTPDYPKDGEASGALICDERLEVDVQATLRRADGVLNEHFDGRLVLRDAGTIELIERRSLKDIEGTFRLTRLLRDDLRADHLEISLRLTPPDKINGYLGGAYQVMESGGAWTRLIRFACFPEQACR